MLQLTKQFLALALFNCISLQPITLDGSDSSQSHEVSDLSITTDLISTEYLDSYQTTSLQYEICNLGFKTLKFAIFGHQIPGAFSIELTKQNAGWVETSHNEVYYIFEHDLFPNTCEKVLLNLISDPIKEYNLEFNPVIERSRFETDWSFASI